MSVEAALADRCEQADGPDRKLDYDIWLLILDGGDKGDPFYAPRYTSSVDEALSLVPKGYTEPGFYGDRFYLIANGSSWNCALQMAEGVGHWSERWKDSTAKNCKSAALAICTAALRASSPPISSNQSKCE